MFVRGNMQYRDQNSYKLTLRTADNPLGESITHYLSSADFCFGD